MATNPAASMPVSCEQSTPSMLGRDVPELSQSEDTINADLGHYEVSVPAFPYLRAPLL